MTAVAVFRRRRSADPLPVGSLSCHNANYGMELWRGAVYVIMRHLDSCRERVRLHFPCKHSKLPLLHESCSARCCLGANPIMFGERGPNERVIARGPHSSRMGAPFDARRANGVSDGSFAPNGPPLLLYRDATSRVKSILT